MNYPTYHAALLAAQAAGYLHVEDTTSRFDPDLEREDRVFPIADYIDLQTVPGQVAFDGVAAHDPHGPYELHAHGILAQGVAMCALHGDLLVWASGDGLWDIEVSGLVEAVIARNVSVHPDEEHVSLRTPTGQYLWGNCRYQGEQPDELALLRRAVALIEEGRFIPDQEARS